MAKVGVIDSGIGGLTNLFDLIKYCNHHYVYVADQKNAPYGVKSSKQLLQYTTSIVQFLVNQQCEMVVVACNTICATVLPILEKSFPQIEFINIITPTISAINQSNYQKLLLIATNATVNSGAYLKNNHKDMEVLATPAFVPAIESMNKTAIQESIIHYLAPYQNKIDCIVLGCTHYPIIENEIKQFLNVDILHSIPYIRQFLQKNQSELKLEIYTTKDTIQLKKQLKQLFNRDEKVFLLEGL